MQSETDDGEEGGGAPISARDVIAVLRRHAWLIVGLVALVTSAAVVGSLMLPNRYESFAIVQIDQRSKKIVDIEGVVSDLKGDASTVESEVEVIRSRMIALRVIDQLKLREDDEFVGPSPWQRRLMRWGLVSAPEPVPAAEQERIPVTGSPHVAAFDAREPGEPAIDPVALEFDSRLMVGRIRNTLLIEIRFASADPLKAARIVDAVADTYIRSQIEAKQQATLAATGLLDGRLKGLRDKLAEAERQVEQFKAAHNIFDSEGQTLAERQLAREMEGLVNARSEAADAKARYEQARRMMIGGEDPETIADVLKNGTVRLLRDELSKALRREAELATKYGARHPEMQKVAADVAKAQSELNIEIGKIIRNLRTEHDVAVARTHQLEAGLERLKQEVAASKEHQWRLRDLEREAAASKQLYEAILSRNKQTAETLGLQVADARLVEPASVSMKPASPNRKKLVLLALIGSLISGIGIAFVLEFAHPGAARVEDAERALDAPVISMLPMLTSADGVVEPLKALRAMLADPGGTVAEAIRAMRHEIDRGSKAGEPRVILLCSSFPGEGKSVIASNLALHFAQLGRRTILIDADLRRAALSRDLGITERPGIVELLDGRALPEDAILRDQRSGLFVMPAATRAGAPQAAAELLSSPQMARVLRDLKSRFDVIVLDAPPLLPVIDARVLADQVDQIVFAMTWRKTSKALARKAVKLLGANRRKLVGIVLNKVDASDRRHQLGTDAYAADNTGLVARAA